jgi:hypothetical protein
MGNAVYFVRKNCTGTYEYVCSTVTHDRQFSEICVL